MKDKRETARSRKNEIPQIKWTVLEIIKLLTVFSKRSKNSLSEELGYSRTTVEKIYKGMNTSLFAYADVALSLARSADWDIDFSELPEMVECALKTGLPLIVGVYDDDTDQMIGRRSLMIKDI